jgi:hypothetical protein
MRLTTKELRANHRTKPRGYFCTRVEYQKPDREGGPAAQPSTPWLAMTSRYPRWPSLMVGLLTLDTGEQIAIMPRLGKISPIVCLIPRLAAIMLSTEIRSDG